VVRRGRGVPRATFSISRYYKSLDDLINNTILYAILFAKYINVKVTFLHRVSHLPKNAAEYKKFEK